MVALRVTPSASTGSRPIDPQRDLPEIVTLLELVFKQRLHQLGRYYVTPSWGDRLVQYVWQGNAVIPGFVWEVNKRIVGNVSLLPTRIKGRYLLANVAVHPDFRRQGIAYRLMSDILQWISAHGGQVALLQVEESNLGAIQLYERLGFSQIDTVQIWQQSHAHLSSQPLGIGNGNLDRFAGFAIRPLRASEWRAAFEIDTATFHPDLNWPTPLASNHYKRSLSNWWADFLAGRQTEYWVAADAHNRLLGLGGLTGEWSRPHQLKLRTWSTSSIRVERPLLAKLLRRLRYWSRRTIQSEHLKRDLVTNTLLYEAGLRPRRVLTTMRLNFQKVSS